MEFLIAALFVLFVMLAIVVWIILDKANKFHSCYSDIQGWDRAKIDILSNAIKPLKAKNDNLENVIMVKFATLENKMQSEKIRTEEFVHGVYKDYTNYIDTKWMNAVNAILEESKKAKTKPVTVKRTSK